MDFASMLPVLLPIALFVVTLIIIFTLRASDKHSKSLSNVKRLLDIYKGNIEASDLSFKQYASELEQTVAKKDAEVKSLIQTVNTQITELKSYSDDLLRLKAAMETYRTALEGLGVLTKDADDKVRTVQEEVDRLDKVRAVIDGFRQDMRDADEHLRKHEQQVIQLERESINRMNQAVSETDSSMDEAMESLHRESGEVLSEFKEKTANDTEFRLRKLDDAFQAVIHTVQQFFGELENKIDEARTVAEKLEAKAAEVATEEEKAEEPPVAEVPSMVNADMGPSYTGMEKADLSSEIEKLSAIVPEDNAGQESGPKIKVPKFTPKTDDEYDIEGESEELAPPEKDTYGDGVSETDDFASFGGVDEESDLRGMDIMDMDFKSFSQGKKDNSPKVNRWQTYGKEEVVDFDDKS
jgi:predicted phage tail protein